MSAPPERTELRGIAASHGVAVGPVAVLSRPGSDVPRRRIHVSQVEPEVDRFQDAIEASRAEIEEVRESLEGPEESDYRLILDAHLLMHRDELIVDGAVRLIREHGINAEWALRRVVDGLVSQLQKAGSGYFRDRAQDVEHVGQHILRWLTGTAEPLPTPEEPTILVSEDLSPADAARLMKAQVLGLITDLGSATSHTAILARTLEIPAVVGVQQVTQLLVNGEEIILDGLHGVLVRHADDAEREQARERGRRYAEFTRGLREKRDGEVRTADGTHVVLMANVELPAEAALAVDAGAEGIGLYRTEFLYLNRPSAPTEDEQEAVYSDVVRVMAPRPVTFRTYDLGGDKLPRSERSPRVPNPALGLRALRLSLARPDLLRAQVRAVARASAHGPVRLMFPLVTTVEDIHRARRIVDEVREELEREGVPVGEMPIGIMVEVPSAALMADALARACDFFSVGTNDLVQYTLALDRTNPQVAHLARALDPAVLRLLATTARAAGEVELPLSMCGDMAADAFALPIVLGLGYHTLSMPYASIPLAREVVGRLDRSHVERVAAEALACDGYAAVAALVVREFGDLLGDLWFEEGIDVQAS